jgi:hypothetical protein
MASITVEGSLMPAAGVLGRGERATWEDSPRLRDLIRKGHLKLISESWPDDQDAPEPAGGHPVNEATESTDPVVGEPVVAPARNASTEKWAEFLRSYHVEFPADASRDDLIAIWDAIPSVEAGDPPEDG